jgi:hypothetical protein
MRFAKLEPVVLALNIALFNQAKVVCYELILSAGQVVNLVIAIAEMRNSVFHNSVFLFLDSRLHLLGGYIPADCVILMASCAEVMIVESHHDAYVSKALGGPRLSSVCICQRLSCECVLC